MATLTNSEAELAGVLAHEVGHVAARHTAERYSRAVVAGLGAAILGAVTNDQIGQLASKQPPHGFCAGGLGRARVDPGDGRFQPADQDDITERTAFRRILARRTCGPLRNSRVRSCRPIRSSWPNTSIRARFSW